MPRAKKPSNCVTSELDSANRSSNCIITGPDRFTHSWDWLTSESYNCPARQLDSSRDSRTCVNEELGMARISYSGSVIGFAAVASCRHDTDDPSECSLGHAAARSFQFSFHPVLFAPVPSFPGLQTSAVYVLSRPC